MNNFRKPILIITLLILVIAKPSECKTTSWERFARDLTKISDLHLYLPLTKSALKDAKNLTISKAEAIYLTVEALGLGFEASLLQNIPSPPLNEFSLSLVGAINLATLMNPPLMDKRWLNPKTLKTGLEEKEAKALIERALNIKRNGGKLRFNKKVDKDLELFFERTINPNLYICYAKFNPRSKTLKLGIELAGGQVQTRERLSEICKRKNALLGINGGFFKADGEPVGALMIDGILISEPTLERGCFGWNERGKFIFGRVKWEGALESQESRLTIRLNGLNRKPLKDDEIILYTSFYGDYLETNKEGVTVVVREGKVSLIKESGKEVIPKDGFIVVGYGNGGNLLRNLIMNERVAVKAYLIPEKANPLWREITFLIQGGPTLIENGKAVNYDENFNENLINKKHPRTIIGETQDGNLILMVIDGRKPDHSDGLTIEELKGLLKSMGLRNALNLDGGGSTTLYFNGQLYNIPSDGKEREISYALLILKEGEVR